MELAGHGAKPATRSVKRALQRSLDRIVPLR
jgi:hypothetical protein